MLTGRNGLLPSEKRKEKVVGLDSLSIVRGRARLILALHGGPIIDRFVYNLRFCITTLLTRSYSSQNTHRRRIGETSSAIFGENFADYRL